MPSESLPATSGLWPWIVLFVLLTAGIAVLVGLLLNVHKMLGRLTAIRREVELARDAGTAQQIAEAVAQLQSAAVSLDRIALRADAVDAKLDEIARRGPGGPANDAQAVVSAIRDGLSELKGPVGRIRELLERTEAETLGDEVRRALFTRGFDKVTILTDLSTVTTTGEHRVLVEAMKEGVRSKGFVVLRDGNATDAKISAAYDMFP